MFPRQPRSRLFPYTTLFRSLLLSPRARARDDIVQVTLAMADEVGEDILDAQLRLQDTRIDERPELGRIRCPALVVAARHDRSEDHTSELQSQSNLVCRPPLE